MQAILSGIHRLRYELAHKLAAVFGRNDGSVAPGAGSDLRPLH